MTGIGASPFFPRFRRWTPFKSGIGRLASDAEAGPHAPMPTLRRPVRDELFDLLVGLRQDQGRDLHRLVLLSATGDRLRRIGSYSSCPS